MNERMEFDIVVNGKKAKDELRNIERDTKRLEESTVSSNSVMGESWITLGLAIGGAALAARKALDAYEKQFRAEVALGSAMKNNLSLMDTNIENWKQYASAIQSWSNIGDDAVIQQMAFLNTLGLTDEQMKAIVQTAAEVSNSGMMPFESAVRNLAKSLSGMSGELGELFPVLRDFTAEQLKAGEGIAAIAESVKGQSDAIASSPVGKWDAMWNAAGDTMEKVGQKILAIIDNIGVLDFATTVFEQLGFGLDLLGLRFEYIGQKFKEFWNIITFDSDEANKAQQRAIELTSQYNTVLAQSKDALAGRKQIIDETSVATNLQADATNKALEAEMEKIYADELAAMGLDKFGDALEDTNERLKESAKYYDSARSSVDDYADSINSLSDTQSAAERNGNVSSGVYKTTTTTAGEYVNTLNPYTYTSSYTDALGNSIPQFSSGGYTGDYSTSSVAGVVHGQEYVVDAGTTRDLGLNGSGGTFNSIDEKLSMLYDINKSLVKMLRHTKDNSDTLERIATA